MAIFVLKKLDFVFGKQAFFELIIDGDCQFKSFCKEVLSSRQYDSELQTIFNYMNLVAQLQILPKTKFRNITPSKDDVKEYEFKSKHLRVYVFHVGKIGKLVAYGGYKNTQDEDIVKFRSYKNRYLKSLQK